MVIYGYLMVTRAVDPVALERGRMRQVSTGRCRSRTPARRLVYVALQELATRIAHRNTGRLLGDPAGYDVMMRVAADENLHHLFYRDLTPAAIELDPSEMLVQRSSARCAGSRCRAPASPTSQRHAARIAGPASTTSPSTTTRSSCRCRAASVGRRVLHGARRGSRAGPRATPALAGNQRARLPPARRAPRRLG